jgi:hypothetical protein
MTDEKTIKGYGTVEQRWIAKTGTGVNYIINTIKYFVGKDNKQVAREFDVGEMVEFDYTCAGQDGKLFIIHHMTEMGSDGQDVGVAQSAVLSTDKSGADESSIRAPMMEGGRGFNPHPQQEIVVVPNQGMMSSVESAIEYWQQYQQLTQSILNDSDYQDIGERRFKKKSAWRKYMRFYNISTQIVKEDVIHDDKGDVVEAKYVVRAIAPNMQGVEAVGFCDRREPNMLKRLGSLKNHDILATAQTRATSRAVSDIIGAGEVSAEEMSE